MTEPDGLDERYRSASAASPSRPPDSVRHAVLAEAARLAHRRDLEAPRRSRPQGYRRPVLFGLVAAAALAGILVIPRLWRPDAPRMAATRTDTAVSAAPADAPAAPQPPARAEGRVAPAIAMQSSAKTPSKSRFGESPSTEPADTGSAASSSYPVGAPNRAVAGAPAANAERAMDSKAKKPIDEGGALRSAAAAGDVGAINALLDRFPDVNARDEKGRTALMLAILGGERAAVDALLARGADVNAADGGGLTPLEAAMGSGQSAMAQALRNAGAH